MRLRGQAPNALDHVPHLLFIGAPLVRRQVDRLGFDLGSRKSVPWIALGLVDPSQQIATIVRANPHLADPTGRISSIHFVIQDHPNTVPKRSDPVVAILAIELDETRMAVQGGQRECRAHRELGLVDGLGICHRPEDIDRALVDQRRDVS